MRQLGESFRLEHRVSTTEGDVCKVVGKDFFQNLFRTHPVPAVDVPRLRIVATGTTVGASGSINGGPEARTVYCGIF